jgi:CcmD family protein
MSPTTAMILVPSVIWIGVWAFLWGVDRRVRALERRIEEQGKERRG